MAAPKDFNDYEVCVDTFARALRTQKAPFRDHATRSLSNHGYTVINCFSVEKHVADRCGAAVWRQVTSHTTGIHEELTCFVISAQCTLQIGSRC